MMLHSLASYFLGSSSSTDTENNYISTDQTTVATAKSEQLNIVIKPCTDFEDSEEDWQLVDREDSPVQTDSEEEIPFVEIKNAPTLHRGRHSRNNSGAGSHDGLLSLSPTSILPNSMEESWYVTPPPCFTSTGPINMETSPFENLLIEHPSMSVYHSMRRSLLDDNIDGDMMFLNVALNPPPVASTSTELRAVNPRQQRIESTNHNNNRAPVAYRSLKQFLIATNGQKPHTKTNQTMCRNALERSNKVREVNSKGGRQKRSDMNHCKVISRANNNRKC